MSELALPRLRSGDLADLVVAAARGVRDPVVVEFGMGAALTSLAMGDRMAGRHVVLEPDRAMAEHWRRTRPWGEVVHGRPDELAAVLGLRGISAVNVVVGEFVGSRIGLQGRVLDQVVEVLAADGTFVTYDHRDAGPSETRPLRRFFADVLVGHASWWNLHVGRIYLCRRPVVRTRMDSGASLVSGVV